MIKPTMFAWLLLAAAPVPAQVTLFPGDANNDGVANQYDLLPIGVAYGLEGIPRPGASPDWQPQLHPEPWPLSLPVTGINGAFADCDGNGLIDSLDIDAIAFNFDSTQNASQPPPLPYLPADTCFSCPKPDLLITFDRDTAQVQDTLYAFLALRYPPNVPPFQGSLGIAFELVYDPDNVKDSLTRVFPDTMPGDLMFVTATNTLVRSWRTSEGMIGFGAAGKGQNAFFAPRQLATVQIVVEDMVIRSASAAVPFWLDASNILIINELEQVVCPGTVEVDTVTLYDPVGLIEEPQPWSALVSLFPNPSGSTVFVQSPAAQILQLEIFNSAGCLLLQQKTGPSFDAAIDAGALPPGFYFIKIETGQGIATRKFQLK